MAETSDNVIRRKARVARAAKSVGAPVVTSWAERSWRVALARAAGDQLRLALDVSRSSLDQMSLAEVLELAPDRGLIAVLEGPSQALGVILIGAEVLSGIIEAMTTGVVSAQAAPDRRPTRTDAAMAAAVIDGALAELDRGLDEPGLADWARGYRYASFLEEIRPLGLLLEDVPFHVLRAEVSLSLGVKTGPIFMALPSGPPGADVAVARDGLDETHAFTRNFAEQVLGATSQLDGVLARLPLTLAQVMDLEVGQTLALGPSSLERITLAGMDGRRLWEGRLGQSRGLRAVRLTDEVGRPAAAPPPRAAPPATPEAVQTLPAEPIRATGTG